MKTWNGLSRDNITSSTAFSLLSSSTMACLRMQNCHPGMLIENIARVRNCPDVAILSSLFGLCLSSFCLFVFLPLSLLSFCLFVFLSFCLFVFLSFCLYVFLSRHHSDEMSEGLEVSKVTICVKILKWHPVIDSLTKVRYRAARAAKN